MAKVCIDAGHYSNYNQSNVNPKYYEAKRMWDLHLLLKKELEEYGIEVMVTRTSQSTDLGLKDRGRKSKGCDLFLSLHSNAADRESADYPLTIYPVSNKGKDLAIKLADSIKSVMSTKENAEYWSKPGTNGGDWYSVIAGAVSVGTEKAIIIEHSFHTNKRAADWLMVDDNLSKLAVEEGKVIANYLGISKKPTSVKTCEVVTSINKYDTADDAKAKQNSKGKLSAGTYYIYNKYPNGYNGMYNLTTSKTGAEAGSWINPTENVKPVEVKKLYRVRKEKNDEKTQKGAYTSLDNAIEACQAAGSGYEVYDWNYEVVYTYKAPNVTAAKPKAIYELDFPSKHLIVDISINRGQIACARTIKKILSENKSFDVEIAKSFFKLAPKYKIDPIMAISQSILETGWFRYENTKVTPDQHNYCGMGVTSYGVKGNSFSTIDDGVTAQLQHLFAYGSKNKLNETILDPRFNYVDRGVAPYWEQLAGRWAIPGFDGDSAEEAIKKGTTYGQKIRNIYDKILAQVVTEDDINKYFPTVVETPKENTPEDNKSADTFEKASDSESPIETPKDKEPVNNTSTEKSDDGTPVEQPEVDTPKTEQPEEDISALEKSDVEDKADGIVSIILEVLKKLFIALADIFKN